jgi:hypothetical protein
VPGSNLGSSKLISALPHNNHPMGEDPEITGWANGVRAPRQVPLKFKRKPGPWSMHGAWGGIGCHGAILPWDRGAKTGFFARFPIAGASRDRSGSAWNIHTWDEWKRTDVFLIHPAFFKFPLLPGRRKTCSISPHPLDGVHDFSSRF